MFGTFTIGDRKVFAFPLAGTFAEVDVVLRWPDGDERAFEAYEDTANPGMWLCSDQGMFEYDDWYALRVNAYTLVTDTTPVLGREFEFGVNASGAAQQFYYQV